MHLHTVCILFKLTKHEHSPEHSPEMASLKKKKNWQRGWIHSTKRHHGVFMCTTCIWGSMCFWHFTSVMWTQRVLQIAVFACGKSSNPMQHCLKNSRFILSSSTHTVLGKTNLSLTNICSKCSPNLPVTWQNDKKILFSAHVHSGLDVNAICA